MNQPLILVLDIGTSSVRSALYDFKGDVLQKTFVKNERTLTATDDGGAEIDAEEAFEQVAKALDDVLLKSKTNKSEIEFVAASSFWHSLVGVDFNGKPTTKVFGWADTRSREHVVQLRKKLKETDVHNRTGARFHSSFWPAKLLWLRKDYPKIFAKTDKWLSFSDFVMMRLCGKPVTSVSMASATGIFDIRKCSWDKDLLKFLQIKAQNLSPIAEDSETHALTEKFAKRWPRLKNTGWLPAIGDGAANNIGAGCLNRSKAALMIGTSGAMRVAYKGEPPQEIPDGLWCYRIDHERVIIGGALSDGGGLYRWLKDNLLLKQDNETEAEIAKRKPASHGLSFLPFLAGERSTGYHEVAAGAIIGLRSSTDTIDIVQAALESVAYRFADIFDQLNEVCGIRKIIASGGALRESPVWTQIIADVLGKNLSLPDTQEASSRGAVLLALETIGNIQNIENIKTPEGRNFKPQPGAKKIYIRSRKRHEQIYQMLIAKSQ